MRSKKADNQRHQRSFTQLELDSLLPNSTDIDRDEMLDVTRSLSVSSVESVSLPELSERYQISKILGEGGYGRVYQAFDSQLQRHVAIKIPHRYQITSANQVDRYLEEARTLAKLDHPAIVAVFDVLRTPDKLPCIVSAYVDGSNLAERMRRDPLTLRNALTLLSTIAEALGFVHSQGIVHRDIKPGNILLSKTDQPFLADFGLALRDELNVTSRARIGTPAYMSPEQARGENHLVDGRSDLFSLGVILYQMLTGKRPFAGSDHESIVESLLHREPRPPRQLSNSIPRDLERICMKLLAKRASDRYGTADDFVDDLTFFLSDWSDPSPDDETVQTDGATPSSDPVVGVVPRGLRSYGRHDAAFFQRLIPGPRDRQWIPESLRFWERRLKGQEEIDSPRVGVLYGPSGCGKSSFVKAGLLPLVMDKMNTVFVEATRDETELRLLRGIRRHRPNLPLDTNLTEALAETRRAGEANAGTKKLLLVIDQFEQWLHGRNDESDADLVAALRQCDGQTVQCLLLVRDDFWLALSRFMAALEIPIRQNHNATLVDLFYPSHARNVLAEFGVAYDRLPADAADRTPEQNRFLDQAIADLTQGGKIFPVRLSLFVEMVKTQSWETQTIERLGGVEGIGLQFLDESFSNDLAPAAQRTHEPAVRKVLRLLLPEPSVDIKGNMQSEETLLRASGYESQPALFDEMMRILDTELRLITLTDPAGTTSGDESLSQSRDGMAYYQLTHDYLVPAIERWITRRQRETSQGRAELRLAEYAAIWSLKPSSKFIPTWLDWASIRLLSSPDRWNGNERRMMRSANRIHLIRSLVAVTAVAVVATISWGIRQRSHAVAAVEQLQTVRTTELESVLEKINLASSFTVGPLQQALAENKADRRLTALNRLGLLQSDQSQRKPLLESSVELDLPLTMMVGKQLGPLSASERQSLQNILLENPTNDLSLNGPKGKADRQLKAAIMLAGLDEPALTALKIDSDSAERIVREMLRHATSSPQDNSSLIAGLTPLNDQILEPLSKRILEPNDSPSRSLATSFASQLYRNRPAVLLDLFLSSSFEQQETMLSASAEQLATQKDRLREIVFQEVPANLPEAEFARVAQRRGVAAALLHRLGQAESTWPLLRFSPRPDTRSFLINRIGPLGGNFDVLLSRFSRDPDPSIRRAILLALGGFEFSGVPPASRFQALLIAKDTFKNDPDAGTHSAAQWLLNRWDERDWVASEIDRQSKLSPDVRKNWFINGEGQTMVILDARSDPDIGHVFAISAGEVTVEQFLRCDPDHPYYEHRSPTPDCPMGLVDWFDSANYARWLSETLQTSPQESYPKNVSLEIDAQSFGQIVDGGAYRLPTASEWRFACAAMSVSRRFYGKSNRLADDYFWYYETSLQDDDEIRYYPAATKMPNDFGMFGMYDGVREWCHDLRGKRRIVMGFSSSTNKNDPNSMVGQTIRDFPADLAQAVNGFYGLRVATTITAGE